ncbi:MULTISPECIES: phage tail protein [Kluyvera]|uniref:phage tail protein n=1 Tax=Kluyvera sp. CHPC 1.2972 TaxID=2995176 RepID=UPI002FD868AB
MQNTSSLFVKSALAASFAFVIFHAENAAACTEVDSTYIGSICYTAANFCPIGYLPADGRSVNINVNQALYSLLGSNYGPATATAFYLPDLRGRSAIGTGQGPGLSTIILGQKPGAETATLTVSNLAPHNHPVTTVQPTNNNVTIPEITGNQSITASLPLATTTPASGGAAPTVGANYLSAISATVPVGLAAQNATFKGPYVQGKPASGSTLPADVSVTGTPTIPSFSFKVPETQIGVTGGGQAFSVRDPAIGLTACIAANGLYPSRP